MPHAASQTGQKPPQCEGVSLREPFAFDSPRVGSPRIQADHLVGRVASYQQGRHPDGDFGEDAEGFFPLAPRQQRRKAGDFSLTTQHRPSRLALIHRTVGIRRTPLVALRFLQRWWHLECCLEQLDHSLISSPSMPRPSFHAGGGSLHPHQRWKQGANETMHHEETPTHYQQLG